MPSERQERNEQAATTLEERQAALASEQLRTQLAAASAMILAAQAAKGITSDRLADVVRRVLSVITPGVSHVLAGSLTLGWRLGRRQVLGGIQGGTFPPQLAELDQTLPRVIVEADQRARARLDEAGQLALTLPMADEDDVVAVLAQARRAVTGAETDAGWVVHRSIQLGKHQAAGEAGFSLVWVAERDACLHCLAYSGRVIGPGGVFRAGLTYGDHPVRTWGPLLGPPLHPNCRCQLDRSTLAPGTLDVGLVREAARSVARGLTDYASDPARFRAAERLVNGTTGLSDAAVIGRLPKSVIARARRDIVAGQFTPRPGSPQQRARITERAQERARRRAGRRAGS